MDDRVSMEKQRAARNAVRILIGLLVLMLFSATAIANNQIPGRVSYPGQLVSTLQPTKSPTFQRPVSANATPRTVAQSQTAFAPAAIPGQTQVDTYTVALYHLDSQIGSTVPDATGIHTATLFGGAIISSSGLYGGALFLDGNASYLRTGDLGSLPQGTIEAFVDFSQACNGVAGDFTLFSAGGDYRSNQRSMSVRNNGYLDFEIMTPKGWLIASTGINPCRYLEGGSPPAGPKWPYDTWRFHHVAATWGPRGTEIWVDGVLHGVGNDAVIPASTPGAITPVGSGTPTAVSTLTPVYYGGWDWCNPQSQMGLPPSAANPIYPICQTPVLVTPPAFPSGDYTGTLPAYTAFLIGCDADSDPVLICFKGRIDEIRISNIQRMFAPSVDPTSTPTPTQTPDVINGELAVDANTVLLHHFNSQTGQYVFDAVSNQWGRLEQDAVITTSGKYNSGLFLDGAPSRVTLQSNTATLYTQGAIEAWINLSSGSSPVVLHRGADYGGYWEEALLGAGTAWGFANFGFGLKNPNDKNWYWVDSGVAPAKFVGAWHHVAGTWGGRGLEIWIDGRLCAMNTAMTFLPYGQSSQFIAGCDEFGNCLKGRMDELRISSIQRSYALAPGAAPVRLSAVFSATNEIFLPLIFGNSPALCGSTFAPARVYSVP